MRIKPKYWRKEVWLTIFIVLLTFYFMAINKMPENITGVQFINENTNCEWDYLKDEFQAKEVLTLELDKYFYTEYPLKFYAYSKDGDVFLEKGMLVFFPKKQYSTVTIIARNNRASCSKTIKVINSI